MTTLQQAREVIKNIVIHRVRKKRISSQFLGKFKGILPEGKTSTEVIQNLRQTLYGKTH